MEQTYFKKEQKVHINLDPKLPKTYFDLIQKVGSGGQYQRTLFFIFALIYFVNGSVMLSPSFIFMNDRYACQQLGLLTQQCKQTICQIQPNEKRKNYFIQNEDQVESAATEYGPFMCEDQYQLDIIKGSPFFGSLLGYITFSYISDNLGRKKTMVLSMALGTLGTVVLALGNSITMISIGMVMSAAGINVSAGILFYFIGETVQNLKRQKYSVMIQISYNIAAIVMTVLYFLIGKWRIIFIMITVIPALITFFFFAIYTEETPQFLLKGQKKKALKSLNRIGYINFGIRDILSDQDLQSVRAEQMTLQRSNEIKISPCEFFGFSSLRNTMILSILLGTMISSLYYGPTLIIDSIGFNTYATSIVIQISQLIGFVPVYYLIDKVERKKAGLCLFLIVAVTSFLLSFIEKTTNCNFCFQAIIEIILIFIFRFAVAVQFMIYIVYFVQLFPNKVIGLSDSIQSLFGGVTKTVFPLILGVLERMDFNLMLFFFMFGIGGCFISTLLNQTVGKPIKIEIDQIQCAKNKVKTLISSQLHQSNNQKHQ